MTRRNIAIAAAAALAGIGVIVGAGLALRDEDAADDAPPPATTETTVPTTDSPAATTTTATTAPVLEDGRHAAMITGIDAAAGTLELDVIQFLTGDAAIAAYQQAHPEDPGGPPNDYFIVNDNPRLRVLAVASDVTVTVVDGVESHGIAWADFPARLAGAPMTVGNAIWPRPFWLTVADGAIVAVDEQYTP